METTIYKNHHIEACIETTGSLFKNLSKEEQEMDERVSEGLLVLIVMFVIFYFILLGLIKLGWL